MSAETTDDFVRLISVNSEGTGDPIHPKMHDTRRGVGAKQI